MGRGWPMNLSFLIYGACLGAALCAPVMAADLYGEDQVQAARGPRHEVRAGVLFHDLMGRETGVDLNAEYLSRFGAFDLFMPLLHTSAVFRPHLGANLNTSGDTSMVYAGYSLTLDLTDRLFIEGSFGGAVHDGDSNSNSGGLHLGCNVLFRETASVGVHLSEHVNLLATVGHSSNSGLCDANNGLTNAGVRLGYLF